MGALERDGRTFVVALLACGWPNNKTYKWSDTRALMQYGIDNYFYKSFLEEGVAFDEGRLKALPVRGGQTDVLGSLAYAGLEIAGRLESENSSLGKDSLELREGMLLRQDENIKVVYSAKDELTAPVERGTVVGTIDYCVDGVVYRRETVVTADSVEAIDPQWCLRQILNRFLCLRP